QKAEQLDGTGFSGGHGGSKLSSIGGTIRLGELVPGGMIRHAMKVNLDAHANLFFDTSTGGFRWPATVADFCAPTCYGGTNPALRMGSLLALPPGFDTSSLETDAARILARGFVDYGAYVVDNTGWSVYGLATEFSTAGSVEQEFARSSRFSPTPASNDVPPARGCRDCCTGLPAGAACTFTPLAGNPARTANLTLATSSSTPPGTNVVSVQATDGTITRSSGFTLTVGDPLLAYDMETLTGSG